MIKVCHSLITNHSPNFRNGSEQPTVGKYVRIRSRDVNHKIVFLIFALLLSPVIIASCSSTDITDPDQISFPDSNISYAAQVRPYLTLSCNVTGCHDVQRPENFGVDLTSWVGVRGNNVAQPGDTNCHLVLVMYGREIHQGSFKANDNQRRGIKQWVLEGAQNN
jgi:hypothetical protein